MFYPNALRRAELGGAVAEEAARRSRRRWPRRCSGAARRAKKSFGDELVATLDQLLQSPCAVAVGRLCSAAPVPAPVPVRSVLRNLAKKATAVLAREKGVGPRWRCEGGTAQVGYAVGQRRRRARSAVTCPPQPVLSRLPRLRVLVQRKSMELPTRIVAGFYKKGGSSARISIRSILDEASNVDTEFAAGRSAEFAGGRRSAEFAEGRRTAVELSNLACVGYNRDGARGGGAAARLYELQQQTDIWPAGRTQL
ncbi:uncharacterized protein [Triticum aestivum]|uniref:uncharacterized protein isoform X2 n=1 Tax=Triticum aestivum TaxID=4565 RepID=UPI001D029858|nr:uncharacterized protein LOC123170411 isoform X2 [Triticum aestivum]